MNIQKMFNDFMGSSGASSSPESDPGSIANTLTKLGGKLPGGLAGGAAAGGIMALLMSNKDARKFVGKAATYGGTALLGGLAYKAYSRWQHDRGNRETELSGTGFTMEGYLERTPPVGTPVDGFQLQLIKSMIASAQADGQIDGTERQRIFSAVQEMELSSEVKAAIFDLLHQTITLEEVTRGVYTLEQKSEIYLAALMVIDPDHVSEREHLRKLAFALDLPEGLPDHLNWQAQRAIAYTA